MAKAFTDEEKAIIEIQLMDAGKKLLSKYGYKKTSIEDIVRDVGISKGAFYSFYLSKEIFFFRVFETIELEMKEEAILQIEKVDPNSANLREELIDAISGVVVKISEKGYINILSREVIEKIFKFLPQAIVNKHLEKDLNDIFQIVEVCKKVGINVSLDGKDRELVSGILRTIFVLILHPEMIGEKCMEVVRLNVGILVDYLMKE